MPDNFAVTSSVGPCLHDGTGFVRIAFAPAINQPQGDGWLLCEEAALVMIQEIAQAVLRARALNRELRNARVSDENKWPGSSRR